MVENEIGKEALTSKKWLRTKTARIKYKILSAKNGYSENMVKNETHNQLL